MVSYISRHDVTIYMTKEMTTTLILCHFISLCHFMEMIQLTFVLFIVSNIPRHDVTINMIEEMTATVVQLQEENRYLH